MGRGLTCFHSLLCLCGHGPERTVVVMEDGKGATRLLVVMVMVCVGGGEGGAGANLEKVGW